MDLVGALPAVVGVVVLTVMVVDRIVVVVVVGTDLVGAGVAFVEDGFDVVEGISVGLVGFLVVLLYLSISC